MKHKYYDRPHRKIIYALQGRDKEYAQAVADFCLSLFCNCGFQYIDNSLAIGNAHDLAVCPSFYHEGLVNCEVENIKSINVIALHVLNYNKWCQLIYQLSHELCHYAIYMTNNDRTRFASWIEETICGAFSLYALKMFCNHWYNSSLSHYNLKYAGSIAQYLKDVLNTNAGTGLLSNIHSYSDLMELDASAQNEREHRFNEMKHLYELLNEKTINGLIHYRDYIRPNQKILETKAYRMCDKNNEAISYLCDLQDSILC